MKTIFSDAHRLHDVPNEFNRGELVPAYERPARANNVLEGVRAAALGPLEGPREFPLDHAYAVQDRALVDFIRDAYPQWASMGRKGVMQPIAAPIRNLRNDRVPAAIDGRVSYYCFDNCTGITSGTWKAVKTGYDIALTATDEVASGKTKAIFGLCRPPGHHAARSFYGGYCFINNAAAAAQYLRSKGAARVTVLDVDYHHGNGTQDIFYERDDVQFISIHADPSSDYPYFLGYADETGAGAGLGYNVNLPLGRGADWEVWGRALETACAKLQAFGPDAVVISLGVDTFKEDPISAFKLESSDYFRVGERIARLGLPTVYIMEGGYAIDEIGTNVANVLSGHVGRG
jgi:acetoin utilization deacetylase AcuC-like enzyme